MVVTQILTGFLTPTRPPQLSKTAHFRVAFYCGQPKAHLCKNNAVYASYQNYRNNIYCVG